MGRRVNEWMSKLLDKLIDLFTITIVVKEVKDIEREE